MCYNEHYVQTKSCSSQCIQKPQPLYLAWGLLHIKNRVNWVNLKIPSSTTLKSRVNSPPNTRVNSCNCCKSANLQTFPQHNLALPAPCQSHPRQSFHSPTATIHPASTQKAYQNCHLCTTPNPCMIVIIHHNSSEEI